MNWWTDGWINELVGWLVGCLVGCLNVWSDFVIDRIREREMRVITACRLAIQFVTHCHAQHANKKPGEPEKRSRRSLSTKGLRTQFVPSRSASTLALACCWFQGVSTIDCDNLSGSHREPDRTNNPWQEWPFIFWYRSTVSWLPSLLYVGKARARTGREWVILYDKRIYQPARWVD